ncbi:uncharacterized protein LOC110454507 isoform X2 [Mizuhopecten yessoensis]|uniref:uncharacterized protein LOC110454507 isoform X2 n=1 Tax=Mizuhopecten yessoensis TaxID=6573 RepID=UPI000B45F6C6|nr:uncharacterized protein LOC110454507 isoform X2 [Mizuhopecten yessoensis]
MASKYHFNRETTNFARLSRVIIDVYRDLLISVLKVKLSPQGLTAILQNQGDHLYKIFEQRQRQILYPSGGVFSCTLEDLDFTILYKLLRNLRGINIPPPKCGWGRTPDPADRSVSANIERLRAHRYATIGHQPTASMSDPEFNNRWSLIRQSVLEIEKAVLFGDTYVTAMDALLTMDIDPDAVKRYIQVQELPMKTQKAESEVNARKKNNYKESMKEEAETQNINLTLIDHARAGKTCLMRQLLRKPIKIGGTDRTNLAELLTKRLRYKLGTSAKERERLEKGKEAELCRLRLRRLRKRREDTKMTLIYQRNDPLGTGDMGPTENETDTSDSSEELEEESPPFMGEINASQMADDQIKAIEDIHKEEKSIDDSSVAYVTLFDFGGDNVFRNCQHCIMSANSIYLLVFDVSLFDNESESEQDYVIDEIDFWMNLVATYAKDESTKGKPPIILIGSHMDEVEKNEDDLSKTIWDKLGEKPGMKALLKHHMTEICFFADMNVSYLNEEKYLDLWCEIEKCVHLQSCWHDIITGCWLALEEKLMLEKEKGIKFLNIKQILDINKQLLVPLEEDELVPFLRYLHNTGSMFCFGIVGKKDSQSLTEQEKEQMNVILDINWIVQAFGAIITDDDFVKTTGQKQRLMWNEYKRTANLTDMVLDIQWNNVSNEYRQVLLSEMKNLGLITEPGNVSDSPNLGKENQSYIVPCLLGEAKPDRIQELLNNSSVLCTKTLCLVFEHQFVPQAVWDKTVAFCIHAFGECTNLNTGITRAKADYLCPKRGFICGRFDPVWNFVLHCKGTMLKLTMFTHHETSLTHGVGQNLRLKIEDILKTTISKANQGHRIFSYYIHCDFFYFRWRVALWKAK